MAIVTKDCSGCMNPFILNTKTLTVTMAVPSNGLRGAKHVPAHKISTNAADCGDLIEWDCPLPGCGYAESEYADDETRKELS